MYCIGCGKQIDDNIKFCPFCRTDINKSKISIDNTEELPSVEYVISRNEEAAQKRTSQKKNDQKTIAITAGIAAVCVAAFLLYIGPKFLGVQFLPIDPFGVMEDNADRSFDRESDRSTGNSSRTGAEEEDKGDNSIRSINITIGDLGEVDVLPDDKYKPQEYSIQVGDMVSLHVAIKPTRAEDRAETEWIIRDKDYGYFDSSRTFDAVFVASAPGRTAVEFTAYTDLKKQSDAVVAMFFFNIEPTEPEDTMWPFKGDIFVTAKKDIGIFIRSDHVVNGSGNKVNDGNKIGWIEGGDISVELIATGNEYHEGGAGHWWYEVEIPEWYRNTEDQSYYFAGRSLIGWVRDDVVRQIR